MEGAGSAARIMPAPPNDRALDVLEAFETAVYASL